MSIIWPPVRRRALATQNGPASPPRPPRLRAAAACLAALLLLYPGLSAADVPRLAPRPLASAFHAMDRGDWDRALRLAARDGAAARDLIQWHRLRAGDGTPAQIQDFLERNPHWPGLDHMRRMGEAGLDGLVGLSELGVV